MLQIHMQSLNPMLCHAVNNFGAKNLGANLVIADQPANVFSAKHVVRINPQSIFTAEDFYYIQYI